MRGKINSFYGARAVNDGLQPVGEFAHGEYVTVIDLGGNVHGEYVKVMGASLVGWVPCGAVEAPLIRAEYAEVGMGMGSVVVGDAAITDTVYAAQGKRIAAAYNAVIAGEYPSGTPLTAEDVEVERRFLAAWCKPQFVP